MKTKRKLPKFIDINTFDFTPYGRELTREEAYLVNGGSVSEDTHTVESGDTLGTLVYNYNQEHGTNLTVNEVSANNGIEDPNLIYVGQIINFGNSGNNQEDAQTDNTDVEDPMSQNTKINDVSTVSTGNNVTSNHSTSNTSILDNSASTLFALDNQDTTNLNGKKETGWCYDPQNLTNIIVDLDNMKALDQVLNILSDPYPGYTVTAEGSQSGKVMNFKNYSELFNYMLYGDLNDIDKDGSEVYFIYTYEKKDMIMKAFERSSIDDDLIYLRKKGISVRVIEYGSKEDILNAFSDPKAKLIVTSGHGRDNGGINTADSKIVTPYDLWKIKKGDSLSTVIFENCYQGDFEQNWEIAFGGNVDVVGWNDTTNTVETRLFNGSGLFDRQKETLRDYINNCFMENDYSN